MSLRDALFFAGTACVFAGLSMWSLSAGLVALGLIFLYLALVHS